MCIEKPHASPSRDKASLCPDVGTGAAYTRIFLSKRSLPKGEIVAIAGHSLRRFARRGAECIFMALSSWEVGI
ncbi:MAG: hypothetical protein ACI9DC_002634 [Gammaproteobacteria bacterium]|jgi:hypothetical protein